MANQGSNHLSELGMALAISRVRVAAFRILLQGHPTEDEVAASVALIARLEQDLGGQATMRPSANAEEAARRQEIESTLSAVIPEYSSSIGRRESALKRLVELLRPLTEGNLSHEKAEELLEVLHAIEESPVYHREPPEFPIAAVNGF